MDLSEYISSRVEALTEQADDVYGVYPGVANSFSSWSALKLILFSASVNMYTTVMNSQPIEDIYYIDALAGSGVSEYDDGKHFLGSGPLACRAARCPFSKMYFIESDAEMADALKQRLEYVFDISEFTAPCDYDVIRGDANEEIEQIVTEIRDISDYDAGFNYFAFIDNQGMDVKWETIKDLTPTPHGDLLINLPVAHAIGRNIDSDEAWSFYGEDVSDIPPRRGVRKQLRRRYLEKLAGQDRSIQSCTKIQSNIGSFYYDLIYATRKIDGGNEYMEVIEYVKNFIERVHSGHVDRMLDIIRGDQMQLQAALPDETPEQVEEELKEVQESTPRQSDYRDFL